MYVCACMPFFQLKHVSMKDASSVQAVVKKHPRDLPFQAHRDHPIPPPQHRGTVNDQGWRSYRYRASCGGGGGRGRGGSSWKQAEVGVKGSCWATFPGRGEQNAKVRRMGTEVPGFESRFLYRRVVPQDILLSDWDAARLEWRLWGQRRATPRVCSCSGAPIMGVICTNDELSGMANF